MSADYDFRGLLLDLEDQMSTEDRKRFLFMLGDTVPKRLLEGPLVDVFTALIERGQISSKDCNFLIKTLENAKLISLAYKVAHFQQKISPVTYPTKQIFELNQITQPIELTNTLRSENSRESVPTIHELLQAYDEDDAVIVSKVDLEFTMLDNDNINIKDINSKTTIISCSNEQIDLNLFEHGLWSDEFLKNLNINIRPYEYQRKLIQESIQAGNTIICLRSGGGKSLIVALLLKYYFVKKMANSNDLNKKKFLAFFLVPCRAMLRLQTEKLKQVIDLQITACAENYDCIEYMNKCHVMVCTPQKLLNYLKAKLISLNDIDLLCFGDCYNTTMRHQYIGIMQYLMCQTIDLFPRVENSPIVIGVTSGYLERDSGRALNNLIDLCATFNCFTITTITKEENELELEQYVKCPSQDHIICINKDKSFEKLTLSIENELKTLILNLFLNEEINPYRIFPEKNFDTSGYEQSLENLKQIEQHNQHFSSVILLNYVFTIYRHVNALVDLTPELILSNLKEYLDLTYKIREHPIPIDTLIYEKCQNLFDKKLMEIEQSEQIPSNPKLDKLVELLDEHLTKSNNECKCLVFVDRLFYAKKICEFLQNHSHLKDKIRPTWLGGSNACIREKSKAIECPILADFRNGKYNVIISTDVVRAGLDIPQCSLVIRYEFVHNTIGSIQAYVRTRAENCAYYLITTAESQSYTKELFNREYEKTLKNVVNAWKDTPIELFKERVQERQKKLITEWNDNLMKSLSGSTNVCSNSNEFTGEILCRACGIFLGEVRQLCRYEDSYFINDPKFYNQIEEKHLDPQQFNKSKIIGRMFCRNKECRSKLGRIQIFDDHTKHSPIYPLACKNIKIKQIDRQSSHEKFIIKKKWTDMPFKIAYLSKVDDDNSDIFYDSYECLNSVH